MKDFVADLIKLQKKHGKYLDGQLRIRCADNWNYDSASTEVCNEIMYGSLRDKTGPFLVCTIDKNPEPSCEIKPGKKTYMISDIEPYRNTIDGKPIGGRRQHREFLKQHGCVEVGNDFNSAKSSKEIRGDFNVRPELSRAVHQVLNK